NRGCGTAVAPKTLKVGFKVGGVLVAETGILLQSLVYDTFQLRRQIGIQAHRRSGRGVQNAIEDGGGSVSRKRRTAGAHFVQQGAKGKQIGSFVKRFSQRLFR